jgi:hypothetical protein
LTEVADIHYTRRTPCSSTNIHAGLLRERGTWEEPETAIIGVSVFCLLDVFQMG